MFCDNYLLAQLGSEDQQILLKSRPLGELKESDFALVETPIPEPGEDEVLNRTIYLCLDPYMRDQMSDRVIHQLNPLPHTT
ncbi:hypothetical protein [Allocoleopsis franciscana]|uniref:hypothetical protein n=1 Tax=Allocoleopsis franciscana TaxID=2886352 RepID=UPI0009D9A63D